MLFLGGEGQRWHALVKGAAAGAGVFLAAAAITVTATLVTIIVTHLIYRMNLLSVMGLTAGVLTILRPWLPQTARQRRGVPAVTYASAFPVVLIFKILLAQILVQLLR